VVIALYSTSGGADILVDAKVYRGRIVDNASDELIVVEGGTFFLRFFVASYDTFGGGVLGTFVRVEAF